MSIIANILLVFVMINIIMGISEWLYFKYAE
jgi:hypothetical protein